MDEFSAIRDVQESDFRYNALCLANSNNEDAETVVRRATAYLSFLRGDTVEADPQEPAAG